MRVRNCSNCQYGQWNADCDVCVECVGYDKWQMIREVKQEDNKEE